jgi:hypothetical protein
MPQRLVKLKLHVINKILNSCELCSRFKNIKRVCIKCKPGFKNPKALSTEVMTSDMPLTQCHPPYRQLILCREVDMHSV